MAAKLATGWQMATNYSFTNIHSQFFYSSVPPFESDWGRQIVCNIQGFSPSHFLVHAKAIA